MRFSIAISLFVASALIAQDLPPAFPRDGSIQLLDNAWGTAWDVKWTANKSTALHRHALDYVGVDFEDSTIKVTSAEGEPQVRTQKKDAAWFLPRGTVHREEGLSSNPARHAVVIELKDMPPGAAKTRVILSIDNEPQKLLENERVKVWNHVWSRNAPKTTFQNNVFIVFLDNGELTSQTGKTTTITRGDVLFRAKDDTESVRSTKGDLRGIIFQLK